MKKYIFIIVLLLSGFSVIQAFSDDGDVSDTVMRDFKTDEEEARAYNVVYTTKTVDGLTFNVQADRPIEKVAGVYRPLDIDSYVALKFAKMQEKINQLEASLNARIDQVSQKVDDLAKRADTLAAQQAELQAQGERSGTDKAE